MPQNSFQVPGYIFFLNLYINWLLQTKGESVTRNHFINKRLYQQQSPVPFTFKKSDLEILEIFNVCCWPAEPGSVRLYPSSASCQQWEQSEGLAESAICGSQNSSGLYIQIYQMPPRSSLSKQILKKSVFLFFSKHAVFQSFWLIFTTTCIGR